MHIKTYISKMVVVTHRLMDVPSSGEKVKLKVLAAQKSKFHNLD